MADGPGSPLLVWRQYVGGKELEVRMYLATQPHGCYHQHEGEFRRPPRRHGRSSPLGGHASSYHARRGSRWPSGAFQNLPLHLRDFYLLVPRKPFPPPLLIGKLFPIPLRPNQNLPQPAPANPNPHLSPHLHRPKRPHVHPLRLPLPPANLPPPPHAYRPPAQFLPLQHPALPLFLPQLLYPFRQRLPLGQGSQIRELGLCAAIGTERGINSAGAGQEGSSRVHAGADVGVCGLKQGSDEPGMFVSLPPPFQISTLNIGTPGV